VLAEPQARARRLRTADRGLFSHIPSALTRLDDALDPPAGRCPVLEPRTRAGLIALIGDPRSTSNWSLAAHQLELLVEDIVGFTTNAGG